MKPKLLIIDDDDEIRTQMKWALSRDYEVLMAEDRPSGVRALREHHPPVALLDLGLPPCPANPEEGFAALAEMLDHDGLAKIIVITGQAEKANALKAIGAGAYDLLAKPVELDDLKVILKRAFHVAALEREHRKLQHQLQGNGFEGMLGTSPLMETVFSSIRKVATTDASVLILGESGTGKEMAALAIHRRSRRGHGPFVPINCGAIPENLLESELFGHEKGSFTGAHIQRKGRIESADQGTLFLDEIGELPLPLKVKLLRFLQEQRVQRVGGRQEIRVDTRVIAATNADIKRGMEEGRFREDLYYRLAVVGIPLPSLRERGNDIGLLAHDFLRRFAADTGKEGLSFDQEAIKALNRHPWPGNVRELENRVKRAVIMAEGKRLTPKDLDFPRSPDGPALSTLREARESVERELIQQTLRRNAGKIAPAAHELGISRPTFYELMEKLRITKDGSSA
jgi:two-component system, NtrC family, response regulator